MSDRTNPEFPPLGEPTPGPLARSEGRRRWRTALIAAGALATGLVAGFVVGQAVDDGDSGSDVPAEGVAVETTLPRTTTTQGLTLPPECRDAMRSAEQALGLLEQGFSSLRSFEVGELDRVVGEMQSLRDVLSGRVRQCLEHA